MVPLLRENRNVAFLTGETSDTATNLDPSSR